MSPLEFAVVALAALPLLLILANLPLYRSPRRADAPDNDRVSVLIPARDEERQIATSVAAALKSDHRDVEVIVLDDGSTDRTTDVVRALARTDHRVKLVAGRSLPAGWNGKNFACAQLAEHATGKWLLFIDADVRLERDAISRLVGTARTREADLLSGIPRQLTGTFSEKLVIPLIHFVLLGFLPMIGMRLTRSPAFAAGIGQLLFARTEAYRAAGGHEAIRASIQDGVALPRAFRREGYRTDLVDLTNVATCRMYDSLPSLWTGFAKNAHEGMGAPGAIGVWTILLAGGHVLPWLGWLLTGPGTPEASAWLAAICFGLAARLILAVRFRQSLLGALLQPIGIALIVAIQWYALGRRLGRRPVAWKGRVPA